jgi:hypothetical protein
VIGLTQLGSVGVMEWTGLGSSGVVGLTEMWCGRKRNTLGFIFIIC